MRELVFLGTGTSTGVPFIGCSCPTCISTDVRDNRWRSSILFRSDTTNVIVDTTPDFRAQCLRAGVTSLDAVIITHDHADHLNGLDDIRQFTIRSGRPMPIHCDRHAEPHIRGRFDYIFIGEYVGGKLPEVDLCVSESSFIVGDFEFEPMTVFHGPRPITALRMGNVAYVTDVSRIPPESMARLRGLDVLILDAVRLRPHPTHFNVEQALDVIEELAPKRAFLTHINHNICHARDSALLPEHVAFAHDGLTLSLSS